MRYLLRWRGIGRSQGFYKAFTAATWNTGRLLLQLRLSAVACKKLDFLRERLLHDDVDIVALQELDGYIFFQSILLLRSARV